MFLELTGTGGSFSLSGLATGGLTGVTGAEDIGGGSYPGGAGALYSSYSLDYGRGGGRSDNNAQAGYVSIVPVTV
jgi:hypothetical protein